MGSKPRPPNATPSHTVGHAPEPPAHLQPRPLDGRAAGMTIAPLEYPGAESDSRHERTGRARESLTSEPPPLVFHPPTDALEPPEAPIPSPRRSTRRPPGRTIAPLTPPEASAAESKDQPGRSRPVPPPAAHNERGTLHPESFGAPRAPSIPQRPRTPAPVAPIRPTPLRAGDTLGRWVLEAPIGEGATASVWSAHHKQLGSPVAIKVFHRHELSFRTVLGEARAAAGIPSPNAIWVYDVDTYSGHHAIVMELCASGDRVAESLRTADIHDWKHAATLIAQAGRGLQAAHACGVFHKDVKPANILLNPGDGRAQITDFGLANPALWGAHRAKKRHQAQSTVSIDASPRPSRRPDDPHAAIRGTVRVGTPEFMAPEQAEGLRPDLDPHDPVHRDYMVAIDVYGLGATLYALLGGIPPFPHGAMAQQECTAVEIMEQVRQGPPPSIRSIDPKLPKRLVRVLDKAMARDPHQRYHSVEAFAEDLEALVAGYPTSLDTSPLVQIGVHLLRERGTVALVTLITLITVASSVVVWNNGKKIQQQSADLEAQRTELHALTTTHAAVTDDLSSTRARLDVTEATLEETKSELNNRDDLLAATKGALAARAAALSDVSGRLDETEGALEDVHAQLTEASRQLQDATLEADSHRLALDETLRSKAALTQELTAARNELVNLQGALVDEISRSTELQELIDTTTERIQVQQQQIDAIEIERMSAETRASSAEARVQEAAVRIRQLREENRHLRRIIAGPQSEISGGSGR